MQDRFLFRVWHKTWKCFKEPFAIMDGVPVYAGGEEWEEGSYEIQQCTGLKDKNGKLIFEHDIVKTLYTRPDGIVINRNCVVEFNRCAFWINYGVGASYLDNDDCIYEVIGNIYQDKELFNEK